MGVGLLVGSGLGVGVGVDVGDGVGEGSIGLTIRVAVSEIPLY